MKRPGSVSCRPAASRRRIFAACRCRCRTDDKILAGRPGIRCIDRPSGSAVVVELQAVNNVFDGKIHLSRGHDFPRLYAATALDQLELKPFILEESLFGGDKLLLVAGNRDRIGGFAAAGGARRTKRQHGRGGHQDLPSFKYEGHFIYLLVRRPFVTTEQPEDDR